MYDPHITLRLPPHVKEAITEQASRFGKTRSEFVRSILETYLNAMKG